MPKVIKAFELIDILQEIETKNMEWGFFGTLKTNYGLSDKEADDIYILMSNGLGELWDLSKQEMITVLDSKFGRHLADHLSRFGANRDSGAKSVVSAIDSWLESNEPGSAKWQRPAHMALMVGEDNVQGDWSNPVKTKWEPPDDLFKKSATMIAKKLYDDSDSLGQAMSRLTFYMNRSGRNLPGTRKAELEKVKNLLRKKFVKSKGS